MKQYYRLAAVIACLTLAPAIFGDYEQKTTKGKTPLADMGDKIVWAKLATVKNSGVDKEEFKESAKRGAKIFTSIQKGSATKATDLNRISDLFNFLVFTALPYDDKNFTFENFAFIVSNKDAGKIFNYLRSYGAGLNGMRFYSNKQKDTVIIHFRNESSEEDRTPWFGIESAKSLGAALTSNGVIFWLHNIDIPSSSATMPKTPKNPNIKIGDQSLKTGVKALQ